MPIDQRLLERLEAKLGVTRSRIYSKISEVANKRALPREIAALALAKEHGIGIARFASAEDLSILRQGQTAAPPSTIRVTSEPARIPKRNAMTKSKRLPQRGTRRPGNQIFIVHGRNDDVRKSMVSFLRSVGLVPIEWRKALAMTSKGAPYIGEILDAAFREATAVVVLLTPDDVAKLDKRFLKPNDPGYEGRPTGQPRPNVLFEAGMAFAKHQNRTILVQIGHIRPFSDIAGRHVVMLSNSAKSRLELITKLEGAGCAIDISGSDWINEGDFSLGGTA